MQARYLRLSALAVALLWASASAMAGPAPSPPLAVTVTPQAARIDVSLAAIPTVDVELAVVNTTDQPQAFAVLDPDWLDHWSCSSEFVSWVALSSLAPQLRTIELQPGEAYTRSLTLLVSDDRSNEALEFRLGFTPADSAETFWSAIVRLPTPTAIAERPTNAS